MDAVRPKVTRELTTRRPTGPVVPALIADAGDGAAKRFFEFFTAHIPNPNTRAAYARAVAQFLRWAEQRGLTPRRFDAIPAAASGAGPKARLAPPSVKQHLAAVRMLFDW